MKPKNLPPIVLDRVTVNTLILEHSPTVIRLLHKWTGSLDRAEDLLHDAIVKVLKNYPSLKDPRQFCAWFKMIALNCAKNRHRNLWRDEEYTGFEASPEERNPDEMVFRYVATKRIYELVIQLPARQRQAFDLRFFQGLAFKEVADVMNCPYDTAKANYFHAIQKIKRAYLE